MKPRRQTLEYLTLVTIGTLEDSKPGNEEYRIKLPSLSPKGVGEILELGKELKLFEAPPIDHVFAAAPNAMYGALAQMLDILANGKETHFAELPFTGFPLTKREDSRIRRILDLEPESSLGKVFLNPANKNFLHSYGQHRHDRIRADAKKEGARHGIVIGLHILVQSIALIFVRDDEEKRRVENITPINGHAMQIDVTSGELHIPSEENLRELSRS